jgi:hypothetical protein
MEHEGGFMKRLASFGWVTEKGAIARAVSITSALATASLLVVGCSKTESLGNRGDTLDGGSREDSGSSGGQGTGGAAMQSGGSTGRGGASGAGGVPVTGGSTGNGGAHAGGANGSGGAQNRGGASGRGGAGGVEPDGGAGAGPYYCEDQCTDVPTTCPANEVLVIGATNCCPHCEPRQNLKKASCIIDGRRYDDGAIVSHQGCSTCLCVDGNIGHCTGVCTEADAGDPFPRVPQPVCGTDQRLEAACVECGPTDACSAYQYGCYDLHPSCNDPGHECSIGQVCLTDVCIEPIPCG